MPMVGSGGVKWSLDLVLEEAFLLPLSMSCHLPMAWEGQQHVCGATGRSGETNNTPDTSKNVSKISRLVFEKCYLKECVIWKGLRMSLFWFCLIACMGA